MAWQLTVAGVDRSAAVEKRSLRVEETRGALSVLSCAFVNRIRNAAQWRPDNDQEVILLVDGVRRAAGYITSVGESPISGIAGGLRHPITVNDFAAALDYVTVTKNYGGVTTEIQASQVGTPVTIVTATPHGRVVGNKIVIADHQSSVPNMNGTWTVFGVPSPTSLTIDVTLATAGGGGTLRQGFTLGEILTDIMSTYVTPNYAITLQAGFPMGGAVMAPVVFNETPAREAITLILTAGGYIFRVSPLRVLEPWVPGTLASGFNVTGLEMRQPVQWQRTRTEFFNRIVLLYGEGTRATTEAQTATGLGTSAAFTTLYPATSDRNVGLWPNVLVVNGVIRGPISWGADYASFDWWWDWEAHTLRYEPVPGPGTGYVPVAGDVISLPYTIQFPATVTAQNATDVQPPPTGRGPRTKRISAPGITDKAFAQSRADELLAKSFQPALRSLQLQLHDLYAHPGKHIPSVAFPNHQVSGAWMIESVSYTLASPTRWIYEYAVTEGNAPPRTWADSMKEMGASITGGGGSASSILSVGVAQGAGVDVNSGVVLSSPAYLGGSRNTAIAANPINWIAVVNYVPFVATASFTARLRVSLFARNAGISATARLYNATDAVPVASTPTVTSQVSTEVTVLAAINAGKTYRLEITASAAGEGIYCIGSLEAS